MELNVNDTLVADPKPADIQRALSEKSYPAGWFIVLDDDDELLDARHNGGGRFSLTHSDGGKRREAIGTLDAARLAAVYLKFLKGDANWRKDCRWDDERRAGHTSFVRDTRPAAGRSGREPPTWAVATIVGVIVLVIAFFSLEQWTGGAIRRRLPFADTDLFWVWLIFLPMIVLIAVAALSKFLELRKAQGWTQTTGRVMRSQIEVRRHRFEGEAEKVENAPLVEYEFTVGARRVRGSRIGIGEDYGGENTEATLARFPVGAEVTVFYDPDDPRNCVLERSGPQGVTLAGCAEALAGLVLVGAIVWWLLTRGPAFVAAKFPKAEAELSVYVATFGLFALWFFVAYRRYLKQAQNWPSARGKVVSSRVEAYERREDNRTTTWHRPAVEYVYSVRGRDYRGNQIKLGMTVDGSESRAAATVAKYPEGSDVEVHYDPGNPGNAALENPTGASWMPLVIALGCFAFSVWLLGIFR